MMWLLTPMVWRAIAAAALLVTLAWVYHLWAERQREVGRQEVRVEWEADKLARAETNRLVMKAVDKASDTLQKAVNKERQVIHARNHSIDLEHDELLRRLRNRSDRPAVSGDGVSAPAGPGPVTAGCTGTELHRQDAEFLVRESARADRLQVALQSCRDAYGRAQGAMNGE